MAEINTGDTAWVLASAALVMLMTPALRFFYGGLVRRKNVLSTIMQSFFILALISVQWALWGYTLVFGADKGGVIGGPTWLGLKNVGGAPNPDYAPTIPHSAFAMFQGMFAVITPALITGAFAERKRFKAFVIFSLAWATFVYAPIAHWIWNIHGWLFTYGAMDFAGGSVVHISSGVAALEAAMALGRRAGFGSEPMEPHNLTYTVLGAGLLWFGWFGFNAGSALDANGIAANAFAATNLSAAMGALTWLTVSWIRHGHPSVLGAAAGAVAGLVGITPAAGYVSPASAIAIGFGAGVLCFFAVELLKGKARIDDALDVFAVHGVGGIWGSLATGIFAQRSINGIGSDDLISGNPSQVWKQMVAVVVVMVFSASATWLILKAIDLTIGLRVPEQEEALGLDNSTHGELAYRL